jgi:hypothetical protein
MYSVRYNSRLKEPTMTEAGASRAAATAAIANAIKAYGAIVHVEPLAFARILVRTPEPLVVHATYGVFSTKHKYLTPYRGLFFFTKTPTPFPLPDNVELVESKKIWVPDSL